MAAELMKQIEDIQRQLIDMEDMGGAGGADTERNLNRGEAEVQHIYRLTGKREQVSTDVLSWEDKVEKACKIARILRAQCDRPKLQDLLMELEEQYIGAHGCV